MKFLVKGSFANNLGDDLFIYILSKRYPQCTFSLIADKKYSAFKSLNNIRLIGYPFNMCVKIIANVLKIFSKELYDYIYSKVARGFYRKHLEACDGYILIGGSMFKEGSNAQTEIKIEQSISTLISKKTSCILGVNFGPYKSKYFYNSYYSLFKSYKDICFRDSKSYELFKENENVRKGSDIIFVLDVFNVEKKSNTVGIVLVDFSKHEDISFCKRKYEDFILKLVEEYKSVSYEITFFAFQKEEKKYVNNLAEKFSRIVNYEINVEVYNDDIECFMFKYLSQKVIFATRFHSMVISLINGQNMCPILYNAKMDNLLFDIGYKGLKIPLSSLSITREQILDLNSLIPQRYLLKDAALEHFKYLDLICNV